MDRFAELLNELGQAIDTPLHPDKNRLCRLNINSGALHVQLEYDVPRDRLLIASFVSDVPPGKFRENVLKDALKANGVLGAMGTLSFSERNNKLTLFHYLPFYELTGDKLASSLLQFIERADEWRLGVQNGATASLTPSPTKK